MKKILLLVSIATIAHTSRIHCEEVVDNPITDTRMIIQRSKIAEIQAAYQKDGIFYQDEQCHDHSHVADALQLFLATKLNMRSYFDGEDIKKWQTKYVGPERSESLNITWVGHATVLIQVNDFNIISDPHFFNMPPLYYRSCNPGISLEQLPEIDFIIISHTHRDHMDEPSLLAIQEKYNPTVLCPLGAASWFKERKFKNVYECNWGDRLTFVKLGYGNAKSPIFFSFLPAIHWCQRMVADVNTSLWGSWMIETPQKTIYFAGDSAKGNHFKEIASLFNRIDVALIPIGPNEPRHLMEHSHMSTQESFHAFKDLNAKLFIPIHWGTFRLGTDSFADPIKILKSCFVGSEEQYKILKFGETHSIE